MTCPAASVRRDAKLVLTIVLICSAALPMNAGSISAEMRRSPGSRRSIRGLVMKALAAQPPEAAMPTAAAPPASTPTAMQTIALPDTRRTSASPDRAPSRR